MNNSLQKYYLMEKIRRAGPSTSTQGVVSNIRYLNPCYGPINNLNNCIPASETTNDNPVFFSSEAGTYTQSGERQSVSFR
jgi:hypothetical protein